jgi:hypothetical protein
MIPKPVDGPEPIMRLSTPLTIVGVFVEILRQRFKAGASIDPELPWTWTDDPNTTQLFIESGWDENLEARNVRPGIWVDRDQNVYNRVTVGDQDQMPEHLGVRLEEFYCTGETDVLIDCTSTKRGESMIIGSVVQDFLHMSSNYIQACVGLRDMSPVILGRTVPFEKDDKLMNSPVSFRAYYEARWATMPISVVLNEIHVKVRDLENPETFFLEAVLRRPYE